MDLITFERKKHMSFAPGWRGTNTIAQENEQMMGTAKGKIMAPFTPEQVNALNIWQNGPVHPFTCGNDHEGDRDLVATESGWICPTCEYKQKWAHEFMLQPPADPLGHLKDANGVPRRIRMDLWTPAEKAIHDAMQEVEKMEADVRLTNAVLKLSEAQRLVADFIDGVNPL